MLSPEELQRRQDEVDAEIANMIGYRKAKEFLSEVKKKVEFVRAGGDREMLNTCLNMVITGNPGTGKTTFARILFRFLRAYGVLTRDSFVEINGLDLKGEYVGSTAPKVQSFFQRAMGGCLFIDEAYALAEGDKFSAEAVRTLLTEVENNRTSVLVIFAGYKEEMGKLMRADPGLQRRFPHAVHLDDYTPVSVCLLSLLPSDSAPPLCTATFCLIAVAMLTFSSIARRSSVPS